MPIGLKTAKQGDGPWCPDTVGSSEPARAAEQELTILITGATGCVGRYIVDRFLAETGHDLLLLVRRPEALPLA
ncbi:MAG: NAD-dependent epimerase/dehydratase family protein, partial [Pseudomonadota bacterium]